LAPTPWTDETHSDESPRGKPRRLGLWLPWAGAALLAAAWSLGWVFMMHETERRLDAGAAGLRRAGWVAAWDERRVGGYPFRLDVDFTNLRLADPSGRAFATRSLKTEAYAFAPSHWVFYAPSGFGFARPNEGAVGVGAQVLRGSVDTAEAFPRLSLEGEDLAFAPAPGAKPFPLARAANLQVYTRAAPADQEAVFVRLTGGLAAPEGDLRGLALAGPMTMTLDGALSHTTYLRGRAWRDAIAGWSARGGTFDVHEFELRAGEVVIAAKGGGLAVGDDGRVVGVLDLSRESLASLLRLARPVRTPAAATFLTGAAPNDLRLTFRDGVMWLGPLEVGDAPRIYEPEGAPPPPGV